MARFKIESIKTEAINRPVTRLERFLRVFGIYQEVQHRLIMGVALAFDESEKIPGVGFCVGMSKTIVDEFGTEWSYDSVTIDGTFMISNVKPMTGKEWYRYWNLYREKAWITWKAKW